MREASHIFPVPCVERVDRIRVLGSVTAPTTAFFFFPPVLCYYLSSYVCPQIEKWILRY